MKVWDTDNIAFTPVLYTDAASVNEACLSCHDGGGQTFANNPEPPPNIEAMWPNSDGPAPGTTMYNKYADSGGLSTLPNTVPQLTKSYSPHRDVAINQAKEEMGGTVVGCLECHPAHSSNFASSVSTNTNIGNPKNVMLYSNAGAYTVEEHLCWGCHPDDGFDYYGDNGSGGNWQGLWSNTKIVAPYKSGYPFMSSHFYSSLSASWNASGIPSGTRNDMVHCSTCHTVHGVDPGEADLEFRVPILRGTWLTSPYKEDRAPGSSHITPCVEPCPGDVSLAPNPDNDFGPVPRGSPDKDAANIEPGGGYTGSYVDGWDGWFIDQNTFGAGNYI